MPEILIAASERVGRRARERAVARLRVHTGGVVHCISSTQGLWSKPPSGGYLCAKPE